MERSVCEQLLGQLEKRLLAECFVSEKLLTPEQAAEIIQSRCYQIRAALDEPNMNDAACSQRD